MSSALCENNNLAGDMLACHSLALSFSVSVVLCRVTKIDAYIRTGSSKRPLTSDLGHELIAYDCTSDEPDANTESIVRSYAETAVPVQNPECSIPEAEPPSKRHRLTTRNSLSSQRRTIDVQPSSSGCSPSASSTKRRRSSATKSRDQAPVQRSDSSASSTRIPKTQTNQRHRNWKIRLFDDKDHSGYVPLPATTSCTPLEYFSLNFDDQFFENAANCTNIYYMTKTGNVLNTAAAEIKKFYGVLLMMGCISYPRIHMYCHQGMNLQLISHVMTRDRFFLIRNSLHVISSDTPPPNNSNPLWKIQPAIEAVHNAYEKIERTPGDFSIDEQMIPFTGRCGVYVLVHKKSRPLRLKNYVVTKA